VLDDNPLKKLIKPATDEETKNEEENKSRCAKC